LAFDRVRGDIFEKRVFIITTGVRISAPNKNICVGEGALICCEVPREVLGTHMIARIT
jgi:hypothetical protein